jgi:phage/plasmid-like protein (TIGR03299 family)
MYENDTAIYYKQSAWHKLGTVVSDVYNPREALVASGLDWTIIPSYSVFAEYMDDEGDAATAYLNGKVANIRSDTGKSVGIVGENYKVLQNQELAEIAYAMAGTDTHVETMGSLRNGGRVYCQIRMGEFEARKGSGDEVNQYMLLCNGHDGTLAFSGLPTSIRVVCENTLHMALKAGSKNMIRITHAGNMAEKITAAKEAMSKYHEIGEFFKQSVTTLANREWAREDVQRFWLHMYGKLEEPVVKNPTTEKEEKNYLKAVDTVGNWASIFDHEYKLAGATAWNAANAVTNWIQHRSAKRGRQASPESRLDRNIFGKNAEQTVQVMTEALSF